MNEQYAGLGIYTTVGQLAVLLGTALRHMPHGPTREECFGFIREKRWLDIRPHDLKPYPSATEPRWQNLLSWARENLACHDLIDRSIRNSWRPTTSGINTAIFIHDSFANGPLDVRRCYMWTEAFKAHMCPNYVPSEADAPRPDFVYEDELPETRKSVRGKRTRIYTIEDFL